MGSARGDVARGRARAPVLSPHASSPIVATDRTFGGLLHTDPARADVEHASRTASTPRERLQAPTPGPGDARFITPGKTSPPGFQFPERMICGHHRRACGASEQAAAPRTGRGEHPGLPLNNSSE